MERWRARVDLPPVVHPVRLDPTGREGPTRGQARSSRWRSTSHGRVVPSWVERTVEQRIVEVAAMLPADGLVTGWAALRLWHGGWFDGLARDGRTELDVPVRVPHACRRALPGAAVWRSSTTYPSTYRLGVPVALPETAALDAMALAARNVPGWDGHVEAVVAVEMAAAAGITSPARLGSALAADPRRYGRDAVARALDRADEHSRSPQETRLRLVWEDVAGFPRPLVNPEVRDLAGGFVGVPDLLDLGAGVVGEYDGEEHRRRQRHRADEARLERFRNVGLERFTVVAGDSTAVQVARMRAARERALWLPEGQRAWRVAPRRDEYGDPLPSLDERIARSLKGQQG